MPSPCIVDSPTIALSMTGIALRADAKISAVQGNHLSAQVDGLHAAVVADHDGRQAFDSTGYAVPGSNADNVFNDVTWSVANPWPWPMLAAVVACFDAALVLTPDSADTFLWSGNLDCNVLGSHSVDQRNMRGQSSVTGAITSGIGGGACVANPIIPPGASMTIRTWIVVKDITVLPSPYTVFPQGYCTNVSKVA